MTTVTNASRNTISGELWRIFEGVLAGLWSIPFPSAKPASGKIIVLCPHCNKGVPVYLPDR